MDINRVYGNAKELENLFNYFITKNLLVKKESNDLSLAHIDKAKHNLEFFDQNKENSKFNDWLIVILYYTLYHCALALVANKSHISKNHTATLVFLMKYYKVSKEDINLINRLEISKEDAEFYTVLKRNRHSANYSTNFAFSSREIKECRKAVNSFLQRTIEALA